MGSSYFPQTFVSQNYSITGPTGPTGDRGNTGSTAFGPRGNTGPTITTMGICGAKLRTVFDNGLSFDTEQVLKGPTGDSILIAGFSFTPGISVFLGQFQTGGTLFFRTIEGGTSPSGRAKITVTPIHNSLYFDYTNESSGLTIGITGAESINSFVGYSGSTFVYISKTNFTPNSSSFAVKNVLEKTRGLGFSGATSESGATCNYIVDSVFGYFDGADPPIYRTKESKLLKINPDCLSNNSVDLSVRGNVFIANMRGNLTQVELGKSSSSNATAVTLILFGASNGPTASAQTEKRFYTEDIAGQVKWPFNVEPCFSGTGGTDVYHFYNLGGPEWFGSVGSMSSINAFYSCPNGRLREVPSEFLGACSFADGTPGGTCFYETQDQCFARGASAFWHIGLTCGDNANTGTGSCCIKFAIGNAEDSSLCVNGITCIDCLSRRVLDPSGITYNGISYRYSGNGITCANFDCRSNSGACCKDGLCQYLTDIQCDNIGGDFRGLGLACEGITCALGGCWNCSIDPPNLGYIYEAACKGAGVTWIRGNPSNPCIGTTGSCCTWGLWGGTCINGVTAGYCTATGGNFVLGVGCGSNPCAAALSITGSNNWSLTDSQLFGRRESFTRTGGQTYAQLMSLCYSPAFGQNCTYVTIDEPYNVYYDNFGYGTNEIIQCGTKDTRKVKYRMYIYTFNLVNPDIELCAGIGSCPTEYNEGTIFGIPNSSSWGPRIEEDGTYNDLVLNGQSYPYWTDEGFWKRTYLDETSDDLAFNTFDYCNTPTSSSIEPLFDEKSKFSPNGGFRRNWGLYNTMRILSADNAGYRGLPAILQNQPHVPYTKIPAGESAFPNCPPGFPTCVCKPRSWTVARLIDKLNRDIPVPENSSSWFIPSYDEMAFIANNRGEIDGKLLASGGDLLNSIYWTSTATFTLNTGGDNTETGVKQTPNDLPVGLVAWGFDFSSSTISSTKYSRLDLKYCRAIRLEMIDDDGNVLPGPEPTSEQYKIWRLPRLKAVTQLLNNPC